MDEANLSEVGAAFANNAWRPELFVGLIDACCRLRSAGCSTVYLDGSYATGKPRPGDFDACWKPSGADSSKLDPPFLEFANR